MRILLSSLLALVFAAAPARAADSDEPKITHTPITKVAAAPIHVTARITDDSKIFPQVFHRYDGNPFELPIDMKKVKGSKDQYEAVVPFKDGALDYYIECYDEFGNGPSRAGSLEKPFRVQVGNDSGGSAAKAAPVAAAAGAATVAVAATTAAPAGDTAAPRPVAVPPKAEPTPPPPLPIPSPDEAERARVEAKLTPPNAAAGSVAVKESAAPAAAPAASAAPLNLRVQAAPPPWTAEEALWHSAILPGWGQFRTERKIRGIAFGAATGIALVSTIWMSVRAAEANDAYEQAPASAQADAYAQAQSYASGRNWALGITIGLWAVNAVEAYLGYGSKDP